MLISFFLIGNLVFYIIKYYYQKRRLKKTTYVYFKIIMLILFRIKPVESDIKELNKSKPFKTKLKI